MTTTPEPQQAENPEEFVSEKQLATRTTIKASTWERWRARGKGPPYYKAGKRCLYKWGEVLAWLESKKVEPKASAPRRGRAA